MLKWVFEKDVFDDAYLSKVTKAAKRLSYPFRIINKDKTMWYTDFAEKTAYKEDEPVIIHGSLALANHIAKKTSYIPGAFCNLGLLRCSAYYPEFGQYLLNKEYCMLPMGDILRQKQHLMRIFPLGIFIRPDSGFKPFAGTVVSFACFDKDIENLEKYCSHMEMAVISSSKKIKDEYRFCVYGKEVISGCQYMKDGQFFTSKETPLEVRKFAALVASKCDHGSPIYILDIATTDFSIGVLELNSFSCSCWYEMDHELLLEIGATEGTEEFNDLFLDEV